MLRKMMLISAGLLLFAPGLRAEESTTKVDVDVEAGYQQKKVKGDDAKFEEYKDVANGEVIPHIGIKTESDKADWSLEFDNVRQEDQSADFSLKSHVFDMNASWDQIPHNYSNTATTLFTDTGDGKLTLPDPMQTTLQAGGTTFFNSLYTGYMTGAHNAELNTLTNTGNVGLGFNITDSLKANLDFTEKIKKGYQNKGIAFGSPGGDVVEIAQPIDFKTYNSAIGFAFDQKSFNLGLNYNLSMFRNDINQLTIDNPRQLNDASNAPGKVVDSVAPDNVAQNLALDGGVNLPLHSRFTALVSMDFMKQSNNLLPYTSNSAFFSAGYPGAGSKPQDSIDAKYLTWLQTYELTGKPTRRADWGIKYRSSQMTDKTDDVTAAGIAPYDVTWDTGPFEREHFNLRKDTLGGDVGYRLMEPLLLNAGYSVDWNKRESREIHKNHEDTFTAAADFTPSMGFTARLKYANSKRRMDDFNQEDWYDPATPASGETPGLRRMDISDRNRDQTTLLVNASKGRVNSSFNFGYTNDHYLPGKGDLTGGTTNQAILTGLLESQNFQGGLNLDVLMTEVWSVFGYYQYENLKSVQQSQQNNTSNIIVNPDYNWTLQNREIFNTVGVGFDGAISRVDIKTGYDYEDSRGHNRLTNLGAGLATKQSLPDTKTQRQKFYIKGSMKVTQALKLGLSYYFERYDVTDWQTQSLPYFSGSGSGSRSIWGGDSAQYYRAHVFGVNAEYKF